MKVGVVSVDGTKIDANGSKHRSVRYDRAGELTAQLQLEISALMARAEASDGSGEEDPQGLPKELARKAALRDQLAAARGRLEAQAKVRAEAERADYEAKVAAREQRQGRAKGKRPKPPDERPRPDEQSNLSDPDSRLMRKSKHHEYRQAYNAQAVVDAGGSQLILGARVSNCASDRGELVADIEAIPAELGLPGTILADNGYANGDEVAALAESGIEALVATAAESRRRRHDFRPAKAETPAKEPKAEWLRVMAAKLASEEVRALYRLPSRPSSRSSASSRRSSASPAFQCVGSTRWPGSGTWWRWPTTASACTSSEWQHDNALGPTFRPKAPLRPHHSRETGPIPAAEQKPKPIWADPAKFAPFPRPATQSQSLGLKSDRLLGGGIPVRHAVIDSDEAQERYSEGARRRMGREQTGAGDHGGRGDIGDGSANSRR